MRLLVGRIGRAHGILGEATIEVRTDEPDRRFAIGATVQTDSHGDLKIISGRVHNGILLLGFDGLNIDCVICNCPQISFLIFLSQYYHCCLIMFRFQNFLTIPY